jgi:hypothetical protein
MGGYTGGYVVTADATDFAARTTAAVAGANLSQARNVAAGFSDGARYGYTMGGYTSAYVATADATDFAARTTAAVAGANLSQARQGAAGFSDYNV